MNDRSADCSVIASGLRHEPSHDDRRVEHEPHRSRSERSTASASPDTLRRSDRICSTRSARRAAASCRANRSSKSRMETIAPTRLRPTFRMIGLPSRSRRFATRPSDWRSSAAPISLTSPMTQNVSSSVSSVNSLEGAGLPGTASSRPGSPGRDPQRVGTATCRKRSARASLKRASCASESGSSI
jgi:hypothetical protein